MEKLIVTEEQVKEVLNNILSEQMKKVSRQDFNRTQFKIEELQNSLNETLKDLVKLKSSVPSGLQTPTKSRILSIERQLVGTQSDLNKLKSIVYNYKKKTFSRQTPKVSDV